MSSDTERLNQAAATAPLSASDSPDSVRSAIPIFLAHGSPRILLVVTTAALLTRITVGSFGIADLLPIVGLVVVWPIQEWMIHVFLLHFKPIPLGRFTIDFPTPRDHRLHHRDPWNYKILFIPLHTYFYSLPLLVLLWLSISPSFPIAMTGICVHLALTLHYEWIHFLIHTRVQPKTRYYQNLWRGHRLHHFKSEHYWFGVTRTEADWLLQTAPGVKEVPTSRTCRDLLAA